jgi:type I restriction enzyme, S subunit
MTKANQSEINWLGTVPEHWEVRRLKFMAQVCNGRDQKEVLDDEGQYVIYGSGGAFGRATQYLYDKPSVLLGRKGTIDKPLFVDEPFWTVDTMFYTEIAGDVYPKYFYYLASAVPFDQFRDLTTLPSMTQDGLASVPLVCPSFEEQRRIASYLDRKTAKIDELIAKKQDLIETLKEKRLAVITRAVTKGLDSNAPLRESDVPWLGMFPSHWETVPLGFLVTMSGGLTPSMANPVYWDGGTPWVTPKDMKLSRISDSIDHVSKEALVETSLALYPAGTVLVVVRGMILAHSFPVAIADLPVTVNQDMKALRCGERLDPEYLFWCLTGFSKVLSGMAQDSAHGTRKIESDTLKKFILPVPPIPEQLAIVESLRTRLEQIDRFQEAAERTIQLQAEYRSALITAAVLGTASTNEVPVEVL